MIWISNKPYKTLMEGIKAYGLIHVRVMQGMLKIDPVMYFIDL
jgi:hypothetical protein